MITFFTKKRLCTLHFTSRNESSIVDAHTHTNKNKKQMNMTMKGRGKQKMTAMVCTQQDYYFNDHKHKRSMVFSSSARA